MNGELMLYRDQWGNTWFARTVKELCEKVGYSKAERLYVGDGIHIGYCVGPHCFQAFKPWGGK